MKRVSKFFLIFGIVFLSITKIYARPKTKIIVNGNDITEIKDRDIASFRRNNFRI